MKPSIAALACMVFAAVPITAGAAGAGAVAGGVRKGDFSVSGHVTINARGQTMGEFMIVVHPSQPGADNVFSVVCRYRNFSEGSITGKVATFKARGQCTNVDATGNLTSWNATNRFSITDNGASSDVIDVNYEGATGVAVPGGVVAAGSFTVSGG